ncbi:MAG: IS607 family transposase [Verrucomicrobia bacterium]|nr:IS607 family transposase [Verrucomicrobiota bacterium]
MRLKDWADSEGIAYQTAWRWFKAGKLPYPAIKTPTGAILIYPPEEEAIRPVNGKAWLYARVSSHDKRDDLVRQIERLKAFCVSRGWEIEAVYSEIASGMNDKRRQLTWLLNKRPERIVVEHKDRLTRFGFAYFELLLPKLGCEMVVIDRDLEEKSDLMKDLIAVIYSFAARIYGLRRGREKARRAKEVLTADAQG